MSCMINAQMITPAKEEALVSAGSRLEVPDLLANCEIRCHVCNRNYK